MEREASRELDMERERYDYSFDGRCIDDEEEPTLQNQEREENDVKKKNEPTLQNQEGEENDVKEKNDKLGDKKDAYCQTEFDEILHQHLLRLEDELEIEREEMEKELFEEKDKLELQLREEYNKIIEAKDDLIRVLAEEKDFLWSELRDVRKSFDLFTRHVHRDALQYLECNRDGLDPKESSPQKGGKTGGNRHGNYSRRIDDVLLVLRKQEENLLRSFEREKAEMTRRFEQEKTALRKLVENECQAKFSYEKNYLLQSVEGLKEGLDCLKAQKDELAKIFDGEKNALELSFKRKEEELRQNLKLDLQRKLINAQKPWPHAKV